MCLIKVFLNVWVIYCYGSSRELLFLSFRPCLETPGNVFSLHTGLLTSIT